MTTQHPRPSECGARKSDWSDVVCNKGFHYDGEHTAIVDGKVVTWMHDSRFNITVDEKTGRAYWKNMQVPVHNFAVKRI